MIENPSNIKPFLRWAGGKQWLISEILKHTPKEFNNYHEPFLGGGSVFVHLKANNIIKNKAYCSDLNKELINSYVVIRDKLPDLIKKIKTFQNEESEYYDIRNKKYRTPATRAAQFLYLNRTSFNGIYRVNQDGKYNVPYGNKSYTKLFDFENLNTLSKTFKGCNFRTQDFRKSIQDINEGDLIFLDPPYTVAHEFNGFVKYNQKIFKWEDQVRLKKYIDDVRDKNATIILTNAAHSSIEKLYDNIGNKLKVTRFSVIGGTNAKRKKYNELLFVI